MKDKVSQSMMKAVREYLEGDECGIRVMEQYYHGRLMDDSTASMKLGSYFEFIWSGALPKNGNPPQPEYMLSKVKANGGSTRGLKIDDMYEPYRMCHENKDKLNRYLERMGLVIARDSEGKMLVGRRLVKGRYEGNIDVVLEATKRVIFDNGFELRKGDRICVDVKYSGMADDKWSKHGWQWTPLQKRYHGTQAKQYHYVSGLPFFFLVVDPGGKYIKFFRILIEQSDIDAHIVEGNHLYERLKYLGDLDLLEARPEISRCEACSLYKECKYKHTFPHVVDVTLTPDPGPGFEIIYTDNEENRN